MSNYGSWLERQEELLKKALLLVNSFGFKADIIREEKKGFVRIFLGPHKIDFFVKEIKHKYIRSIWLCKKEDFNPEANYLLYYLFKDKEGKEKEGWLIGLGKELNDKIEYRKSDYHKNVEYVVVPIAIFRPAKRFLKRMMNRWENFLQKRMTEWL